MSLILWTGFENSKDLKSWFCNEEQDWVQIGVPLTLAHLFHSLVFSVPRTELEQTRKQLSSGKFEPYLSCPSKLSFVLCRDDSTRLPVYEAGESAIKTMTVFGEFCACMVDLCVALGFEFVTIQTAEQAGSFELLLRFPVCANLGEVLRVLGLMRAGMEIMAYSRGFKMVNLCWRDVELNGNLLLELEHSLC